MDCVFTTATVLLSPEFSEANPYRTAQTKLKKLRLVTGVQFTCKANKTYALHGTWTQIQASSSLLTHWQTLPDHEPTTITRDSSDEAPKLCDCTEVKNVLVSLEKVQCETESRNEKSENKKSGEICINTALVRKDIEHLTTELKSQKNTNLKSINKSVVTNNKSVKKQNSVASTNRNKYSSSSGEVVNTIADTDISQTRLNIENSLDNKFENRTNTSKEHVNGSTELQNTLVTVKDKEHDNSLRDSKVSNRNNPRKTRRSTASKNDKGEVVRDGECDRKGRRKPGDKGYWSRAKRNDIHEEHQCKLCGVVLKSRKRFLEHKRRIHLKEYQCSVCLRGFGYPIDLKRHKCPQVPDAERNVVSKGGRPKKNVPLQTETFQCKDCSFSATSQSKLDIHFKRTHMSFPCGDCGVTFKSQGSLSRHMKTVHNEQTSGTCEICSKTFKSNYQYLLHLKTHEVGYSKASFMCAQCGKTFTTKYALSLHHKSVHLGIRQDFLCQICGKSFRQRNSYRQHTNAHEGIKPYHCDQCGQSFTYHKSLREHMFMHDSIRRFKCDLCNKKFRQRTTLYIHMKTHKLVKDHICTTCGKQFSQKQALVRHERVHSGVRPYKCTVCQKEFGDASTIRRHMLAIHRKTESDWKHSIICTVNKKSDYYVQVGSDQNSRTYEYKCQTACKTSSEKVNENQVPSIIQNGSAASAINLPNLNYVPSVEIEQNQSRNLQPNCTYAMASGQPMAPGQPMQNLIQVPMLSNNTMCVPVEHAPLPSVENGVTGNALPNRGTPNSAANANFAVQNSAIQLQGNSLPGNLGQLLDLSAISFIQPKPEQGQITPTGDPRPGVQIELQPDRLQQQFYHGHLDEVLDASDSVTSNRILQTIAFVPVVTSSESTNLKFAPPAVSTVQQVPLDQGVNQSVDGVWGFVGYPSCYSAGSTTQHLTPSTTR